MTINDKMNDTTSSKPHNIYSCLLCGFNTQHKRDYNNHLATAKHRKMTENDTKKVKHEKKTNKRIFECNCGNIYKYRQGLFAHKKKCNVGDFNSKDDFASTLHSVGMQCVQSSERTNESSIPENTIKNTKNLVNGEFIMEMFKENQEFKTLLIEQCRQSEMQQKKMFELQQENNILMNKMVEISQTCLSVPTTINNNNNTTTNNTQFNIQLFLNETCKNAINFTDFIDNIQVTDDDLENNAKMGFVEGVTKIILDNLKQLELINRPIHCTDIKRETIYVKEENEWDKENSHTVIQRGFQDITCKNMQQLVDWRENNPSYADDMDSELGEKSIVMQQNSMAGSKREEYYPKIIRNIAKETVLDKKRILE